MNHKILYGLIALVVVFSVVNLVLVTSKTGEISSNIIKAKEDSRPADIEVVKLKDSSCSDCFNIEAVLSDLKSKNFNVVKETDVDPYSEDGRSFIQKFGIQKLPTLIVSGEIKKSSIENVWKSGWELKSDSGKEFAIYQNALPPYVNPSTKEIIGRVDLTYIIDSSCQDCQGLLPVISYLKKEGKVVFSKEKTLEYQTSEAQEIIRRLGIQRVPAIVLTKNIVEYPGVKEVLGQLAVEEKQGFYAMHGTTPPYRDLATGGIKGLVNAIYLVDASCKTCYDIDGLKNIVTNVIGLTVKEEKETDISSGEGGALIAKYKIEKVPTLLLSPEAADYDGFSDAFEQVGTKEQDGWFVIKNPQIFGSYKDLTTNKEVAVNRGGQQPSGH